jgi:hypothetical protein
MSTPSTLPGGPDRAPKVRMLPLAGLAAGAAGGLLVGLLGRDAYGWWGPAGVVNCCLAAGALGAVAFACFGRPVGGTPPRTRPVGGGSRAEEETKVDRHPPPGGGADRLGPDRGA